MNRSLLWLLVPIVALAVWIALRFAGEETAPAPDAGGVVANVDPAAAIDAADIATAPIAAVRVEAAGDAAADGNARLPIPDDAIWLDVRVIDAETKQPVAGAEVRWSTSSAWQQIAALPERDRQDYVDQERGAERFGWLTRTDREGLARVGADKNGASVHARSEGRYGTADIGGQRELPTEGWVLELERDLTLRARVVDALGRPAVGAFVGIRMFDLDGKAQPNRGWIQAAQAKAPDAVAEFRHVQRWLRFGTSRKREMAIGHWRVTPVVPGVDEPGVEFDVDNPPPEPVELRLPATGSMLARLLHDGQPLTKEVTFKSYRGDENDFEQRNGAPRHFVDDDGWARLPFVAVGGPVVVMAQVRGANVCRTVAAPVGQDQELRVELTTEGLFVLHGQFVGPDGALLTNASVGANFDFEILQGSHHLKTDAQGRFLWLLNRSDQDRAQIKRLVFSQRSADDAPAHTLNVPPRELRLGANDLGVLQLSNGAVVVAGQLQFDGPQRGSRSWFAVEVLSDRLGPAGEEQWHRAKSLSTRLRDDGSFEVRGETKPVRHRLAFSLGGHLPMPPIEFRVGATDLMIPIRLGHQLKIKLLVDADVPADLLRGTLLPAFTPPPEYSQENGMWSQRGTRYQVQLWGLQGREPVLRWQGLPAGTYALEVGAMGLPTFLMRLENVVLPLPSVADDRLEQIDLRGKLQVLDVRVSASHDARHAPPGRIDALVFPMPQADDECWQGLQVDDGKLSMLGVSGPLELMVVGKQCQPQRVLVTAEQAASGKVNVELRAWPKIDLLFGDLPTLPDGIELRVLCPQEALPRDERRFTTFWTQGGLDAYTKTSNDNAEVVNGRAAVTVGDGTFRIGVYLATKDGTRKQTLRSVSPSEIQGGENLAPIAVQLSAEEIAAAVAKLQAPEEPGK